MTDEARRYEAIGKEFASHGVVDHSRKEYGYTDRETGAKINTNTVEGYYSIFKRGMKGVYQHCSEKHLHRYLAEFDFRYSNRSALGCEDVERADSMALGIVGKRLTYRRTNEAQVLRGNFVLNDADEWQITCTNCGHKTHKQIGWLRVNDSLVCFGCTASPKRKQRSKIIDNLKDTVRQLHRTALLL